MRVLGIDPGTKVTGYGVIDSVDGHLTYVASGAIKTKAKDSMGHKLNTISLTLRYIIGSQRPEAIAMEAGFIGSNPKTALVIGYARAAVLMAAEFADLDVTEYTPTEIKRSVASGGSDKQAVMWGVNTLFNICVDTYDESDALAVAICHANHLEMEERISRQPS